MEFDLRTVLESLPDEAKSQEFLARLEQEGPTAELIADINDYLQARVDASMSALGVQPLSDADPALEAARKEALEATEAAMNKYKAAMADIENELSDLQKETGARLDEVEAEDLKKKISDAN